MLTAAALISTTFITGSPGTAFASCNPGRTHDAAARHVGAMQSRSSLTGVKASIEQYNPYYSGDNNSGTNASVMLVKGSPTQWVQLGWLKSQLHPAGTTTRETFVEVFLSLENNRFYWWSADPVGNSTAYKILHNGSRDMTFYMNGSQIMTTNGAITQPTQYQIFGETHDKADQMPGGTGAHVTFSASRYYTGAGHSAVVVGVAPFNEGSTIFGVSTDGNGSYDIWDKGCSS